MGLECYGIVGELFLSGLGSGEKIGGLLLRGWFNLSGILGVLVSGGRGFYWKVNLFRGVYVFGGDWFLSVGINWFVLLGKDWIVVIGGICLGCVVGDVVRY